MNTSVSSLGALIAPRCCHSAAERLRKRACRV
jgi:hypothetical protein